jgi:stalled ribosome rescue protein Dom34
MKTAKRLGVYLDHSQAHFFNYPTGSANVDPVDSDFTTFEKAKTLSKSENSMHNKEQQELRSFFKKIAQVIMDYEQVVFFGPTDAKVELFNYLRTEHKYDKIEMVVQNSDRLNENSASTFVDNYFENL